MQAGVVICGLIDSKAETKMIVGQFIFGQYACEVLACRILDVNNLGHLQESFNKLMHCYSYLRDKVAWPTINQGEIINEVKAEEAAVLENPQPVVVDELLPTMVETPQYQEELF